MKDPHGRDMIRLGDAKDHGGEVIEAAGELKHRGIAVTAAAANAAIYNAAAQTPPASDSVAPRMTQDAVRMLDMLNHNATVRVLYLAD